MKKILLSILIFISLFGFAGCNNNSYLAENEICAVEQISSYKLVGASFGKTIEGVLAIHIKDNIVVNAGAFCLFNIEDYHEITVRTVGDDYGSFPDSYSYSFLPKGDTVYVRYSFWYDMYDDNSCKINCYLTFKATVYATNGIIETDDVQEIKTSIFEIGC